MDVVFCALVRRNKITMTSIYVAIFRRRLRCLGPYMAITSGNEHRVEKLWLWSAKTIYQWHIHECLANKLQGIIIPAFICLQYSRKPIYLWSNWLTCCNDVFKRILFSFICSWASMAKVRSWHFWNIEIKTLYIYLCQFGNIYTHIYIYGNCAFKTYHVTTPVYKLLIL